MLSAISKRFSILLVLASLLFTKPILNGSFIFLQENQIKQRNNPADPGGINFQGYKTQNPGQMVYVLNIEELKTGRTTTAVLSNHGWKPLKYRTGVSPDLTGKKWLIMTDRIFKVNLPKINGYHNIYSEFLLADGSIFCCTNQTMLKIFPGHIKIASFNIRQFNYTKLTNTDIMNTLAKIITNFDITAIQEIGSFGGGDTDNRVLPAFHSFILQLTDKYDYIISPRIGTGGEMERYAFIYNKEISIPDSSFVYDDRFTNFTRPPFVTEFLIAHTSFILCTIHTKPGNASNEISALEQVFYDLQEIYNNTTNIIILGDLNADNSAAGYFDESQNTGIRDLLKFSWVIDDTIDTTTSPANNYTYDRIIFRSEIYDPDYIESYGVFKFNEKYQLKTSLNEDYAYYSDHYPVWCEFSIK